MAYLISINNLILPVLFVNALHRTVNVQALTIVVFGGSGFVGRRVCKTLVSTGCCDQVISISRSGKPPPYYCQDNEIPRWSDAVSWIRYEIPDTNNRTAITDNITANAKEIMPTTMLPLPPIDAAISCIGNLQPRQQWKQLFGLSFDDERLYRENGIVNENACHMAKNAGASRFAYISVSYEVAKCLEGPIEGYLDGKRHAERSACRLFGANETVVVGPSLIYGGKRFPRLGLWYRRFVESGAVKAYIAGNDFLRGLDSLPAEDWVEKMVFSSPVDVDVVARVLSGAGFGLVSRNIVGARRQGFFDQRGKPVVYDDVVYVDGTHEIERIDQLVNFPKSNEVSSPLLLEKKGSVSHVTSQQEPAYEGALLGKRPLLYPLPVAATFLCIFYVVATSQFVEVIR